MFEKKADPGYWDAHWKTKDLEKSITTCKSNNFIIDPLKKYLRNEKGIILEGGCGRAQNVYTIKHHGYNVVGIDYAEQTVKAVNLAVPELDVKVGDVRNLYFQDGEVAGYWSLGVIEHFWEGYDIINEMIRVLRDKNGFLFLTFPYISPLRRLKASLGCYDKSFNKNDVDSFYQFILNHKLVLEDLRNKGFSLREATPFDGIKGFKHEVSIFKPFLQPLYDGKFCNGRLCRIFVSLLERIFRLFAAHCILLILEKHVHSDPTPENTQAEGEVAV